MAERLDSKVGGISPAFFMCPRIDLMPEPLVSAKLVSWNMVLINGLRCTDPGSPSVSGDFNENPGLITSMRLEYLIIWIGWLRRNEQWMKALTNTSRRTSSGRSMGVFACNLPLGNSKPFGRSSLTALRARLTNKISGPRISIVASNRLSGSSIHLFPGTLI